MRKTFFFVSLCAALVACSTSNTKDNDPWGKIDTDKTPKQSFVFDLSMYSSSMGRNMTYSVYLPAGYDKEKSYPIFFLLHGYEDTNQSATHNRCWLDKGNAAKIADDYMKTGGVPMVIVMPNGLDKFYVNDGYEKYFEEELMPKVEADYKCNGKRAIGGLSMGGFGTLYHSLKYPHKFTYAYAMSPAAKLDWGVVKIDPKDYIALQEDKSVFPSYTIEVGLQDITVNNNDSKALYRTMEQNGIHCEWIEREGTHDWPFWKVCLPKALRKVGESFK